MSKVLLLMSGGVDSSYCAHLLKAAGHEVFGLYLRLHNIKEKHEFYEPKVQKCAQNLGFKVQILDKSELFKNEIYEYFVKSYANAQTPNPCALCNPKIKFAIAFSKANEIGCEFVASGHYAQVRDGKIAQAADISKDQSYFLFGLPQEQISRLIFPLGALKKEEIKPKALEKMPWLGTLQSYHDSQEVCFVAENYCDTLNEYEGEHKKQIQIGLKEGLVRNEKGEIIGTHEGFARYTIGKRKGLKIEGSHKPHFVLKIDPTKNEIIASSRELLAEREIFAKIWMIEPKTLEILEHGECVECEIKYRYKSPQIRAKVSLIDLDSIKSKNIESSTNLALNSDSIKNNSDFSTKSLNSSPNYLQNFSQKFSTKALKAELSEDAFAVAKGQMLVLYKNGEVLGGGEIL